jgi:exosortase/archaeosortase family protein
MATRYSRNLKLHKTHFFVGLVVSLLFIMVFAFQVFNFWIWEAEIVSRFLSFAEVPHTLSIWSSHARSPTFWIPVNSYPLPLMTAVVLIAILASFLFILSILRKIPSPIKTIAFVVSMVAIFALLWQTIFQIERSTTFLVTLDWSCSGVISLFLITLIFVPLLFTIRGPLWIKIFWLFLTMGFSILWNLLRISFVTATLYYFGGSVFLLLHYFIGAFVDFVYIVTFYSLALAHLSKVETAGVINFGF